MLVVTVNDEQTIPRCDLTEILNTLHSEMLFIYYFYGLFLLGQRKEVFIVYSVFTLFTLVDLKVSS